MAELAMRLWRGDAAGGDLVDYRVAVQEGEVVLDAVHRLQATEAPDLAVRWNCKAGKCGSCSAEINGMPRLMCMTRLNMFAPGETVTVTPMRTFPVIRDLVTDVTFNFEMTRRVPAFSPPPREPGTGYRMAQVDVERGQEFRKCIECFLCQDTCHVIRDHEENKTAFAGPRLFIKYAELEMHPLDRSDRRVALQQRMGLGMCNVTKCCTEVCPEHIKITDNAIIPLKERVVDRRYDPLVFLGSRIGIGPARAPVGPAGGDGPSPIKRPSPPAAGAPAVPAASAVPAAPAVPAASAASAGPAVPAAPAAPVTPAAPAASAVPVTPMAPAVPAASGNQFTRWLAWGGLPAVGAGMAAAFLMRRRRDRR